MSIKTGQAVAAQFIILDATGALIAADAPPVGTLVVNGVDNAAVVTITTPSMGVYKWACTLPALAAGDVVQMRITATVATIDRAAIVWVETADTKRVSDLNDIGAAAVWAAAVRTLTQAAASVTATETAGHLVLHRGDFISKSITGLGSLVDRTKLWLTVKHSTGDEDSESVIQLEETGGLLYLNGAAVPVADADHGTLVVDDATAGDITFTIANAESAELVPQVGLSYDVQVKRASGNIETKPGGTLDIEADVTRAVT